MQVQRIHNNNNNPIFQAKLKINYFNELSSDSFNILKKKAEQIGYDNDIVNIRLGARQAFRRNNVVVYEKQMIYGEVLTPPNKLLNEREIRCYRLGNDIPMKNIIESRIGEYLDDLKELIRK